MIVLIKQLKTTIEDKDIFNMLTNDAFVWEVSASVGCLFDHSHICRMFKRFMFNAQ